MDAKTFIVLSTTSQAINPFWECVEEENYTVGGRRETGGAGRGTAMHGREGGGWRRSRLALDGP